MGAPPASIPPNWNQICYDAAGNLIADGAHTYTYDAEGNITQVDTGNTATYTYDGLNRRARIDFGSSAAEEFLFDSGGRHSSSWDPINHWEVNGWAYWGGFPAAFYGNGTTEFEHQDWLGTERARTSVSGQIAGTYASLPFGDGFSVSGNDWVPNHFAGLDHDNAGNSDTHHAQFRQYSSTQGHWMAPDHYAGSYDLTNPQSFNRYAYVTNNPMAFGDPSGLDECDDCDCDPLWQDCFGFGVGWGTGGGGAPPKIIGYKNLDPNQIMTESLGLPPGMLVPSADIVGMLQGTFGLPSVGQINCLPLCTATDSVSVSNVPWYINIHIPPEVWAWAMHGEHRLVHGGWKYGNWCGPGGAGAPINDLDAYCLIHDYCYWRAHVTAASNFNGFGPNPALGACNQALCDGAASLIGSKTASTIEQDKSIEVIAYFTIAPFRGACYLP